MLRFSLLASGSRGNALFIASDKNKILIDNGLSLKQLEARVGSIGESLDGLTAVLVTHEHSDHVRGLGVLARRYKVPIYVTEATASALPDSVGLIPHIQLFEAGDTLDLNTLRVSSFSISHDAADPVSYVIQGDGATLGLAADMGHAPTLVRQRLRGANGLILESNYCPDMLRRGPYPPMVQQRIRGKHGHLSNGDSNTLLSELLHDDLRVVILSHLSQENNCHDLALKMAQRVLAGHSTQLHVAYQDTPSQVFTL